MLRTALLACLGLAVACESPVRPSPSRDLSEPAPVITPEAAPLPSPPRALPSAERAPPAPAHVEQIEVPGQLPVSIVRSTDGSPPRVVFFPGVCSNAYAYLAGFPEAARAHGGAIAIDGDRPCGAAPGFRSITSDPAHEEPRIDAALRAAGVASPEEADLVLVGYSLGATLIENLVRKSPERYRRVVLIGSPRDPRLDRLKGALRVATMSCSLDVPARMKAATRMLENASIPSRYFEMPGCTHGNLADAERVMTDALGWASSRTP